jgi:hypothetical protein
MSQTQNKNENTVVAVAPAKTKLIKKNSKAKEVVAKVEPVEVVAKVSDEDEEVSDEEVEVSEEDECEGCEGCDKCGMSASGEDEDECDGDKCGMSDTCCGYEDEDGVAAFTPKTVEPEDVSSASGEDEDESEEVSDEDVPKTKKSRKGINEKVPKWATGGRAKFYRTEAEAKALGKFEAGDVCPTCGMTFKGRFTWKYLHNWNSKTKTPECDGKVKREGRDQSGGGTSTADFVAKATKNLAAVGIHVNWDFTQKDILAYIFAGDLARRFCNKFVEITAAWTNGMFKSALKKFISDFPPVKTISVSGEEYMETPDGKKIVISEATKRITAEQSFEDYLKVEYPSIRSLWD